MIDTLAGPLFRDRSEAGLALAEALGGERQPDTVVVGLARGGVPVAAEVARVLEATLDAVAVRKVRHPRQPEYAIGAVDPLGGLFLRSRNGLTNSQVSLAVADAQRSAEELDRRLHPLGRSPALAGRRALIIDDGLATGATMVAAARWAWGRGATRVVSAAPVGSTQGVDLLRREANLVVCLYTFSHFDSVGRWYREFSQVDDAEVVRLLAVSE